MKKIIWSFLLVVVCMAAMLGRHYYLKAEQFEVYSIIDEKNILLPEYLDKPAVILFWVSTCSPCKLEMSRLHQAILSGKIPSGAVYAVNVGDSIETVTQFAENSDLPFQFFWINEKKLVGDLKVSGTPTTIHFNSNQKIVWSARGVDPQSIQKATELFSALL